MHHAASIFLTLLVFLAPVFPDATAAEPQVTALTATFADGTVLTLTLDAGTGKAGQGRAGQGRAGRQLGAYSLNALLAPRVELDAPTIQEANGSFERSELESAFSWLCNQASQTRFELQKFHSVSVNGDQAKVELTLTGLVELPTYRPADGTYGVTFDWEKAKDGWRLTRATWKQVHP